MLKQIKRQLATRRSLVAELASVAGECVTNNVVKHFRTLQPTVLQLNVNAACNAKCNMCNIWKTEDKTQLSLEKLDETFTDPAFRRIEYIILAGGEPTLRKDLPEVVGLMLKHMPKLRKLSIPTTGISTELSVRHFSAIATLCLERNVVCSIGISLDGVGEVYDRVRGVPGGYEKVINTLHALKELNQKVEFQLSVNPTISAMNVRDVHNLVEVSKHLELGINFFMATLSESYFNNLNLADSITMTAEDRAFLEAFLRQRINESPLMSEMPFYYEKALEMLKGAKRSIPCPFQDQGIVLDANGDFHYCTNSRTVGNVHQRAPSSIYHDRENLAYRRRVRQETCPGCQISCFVGVGLRKTVFPFLGFTARHGARRMWNRIRGNGHIRAANG